MQQPGHLAARDEPGVPVPLDHHTRAAAALDRGFPVAAGPALVLKARVHLCSVECLEQQTGLVAGGRAPGSPGSDCLRRL